MDGKGIDVVSTGYPVSERHAGLYLADDLYLVAHDRPGESAGLSAPTLCLGLAGALLAELVLVGRLMVQGGRLAVVAREAPADSLMHEVLAELVSHEDERDLRRWLEYLSRRGSGQTSIRVAVAERLTRAGLLAREQRRGLLRSKVMYVPVTSAAVGWPGIRLSGQATRRERPPVQDLALAGLVGATGLSRRVFGGRLQDPDGYVRWCVDQLDPSLQELIGEVRAAVGRTVTVPL